MAQNLKEIIKVEKHTHQQKKGSSLKFVCPIDNEYITQEELINWNYLAGLIDGEGHIGANTCSITQGIEVNYDVYLEMKKCMDDLSITYNEFIREKQKDHHQKTAILQMHNCKDIYRKLLKYTRIAKKKQIINRLMEKNHMFIRESDKVVDIKFSKREAVYAIETETGNYIAWGYASSNSQYQQQPISAETQVFHERFFRYYDEKDLQGKYLKYFTICDPAISQSDDADNTVIITMAKEADGPNIYRIREDAGHFSPKETIDIIFKHREEYNSDVFIETFAYQKALKFAIEEEQKVRQQYFILKELKDTTKAKEFRIQSLIPLYERGILFHKHSDIEYETELLQFPGGKHDDRIDAAAYITTAMSGASSHRGKAKQFHAKSLFKRKRSW